MDVNQWHQKRHRQKKPSSHDDGLAPAGPGGDQAAEGSL